MPSTVNKLKRAVTKVGLTVTDREGSALVRQVTEEHLTFLDREALSDLRQRSRSLKQRGIPGSIIEAGCALGGSAIVLARSKEPDRPMFIHDVFGMIPSPGEKDGEDVKERYAVISSGKAGGIGGETYYGYRSDLVEQVEQSFSRFQVPVGANNVQLVKGLFEDTLHPDGPVALAHIDGDWYDSVTVCLQRIWPVLSKGGAIVIDDYYSWSGCRSAFDDFLPTVDDCRVEWLARPHLVKI